jgi:hypothetical protein
MTARVRSRNGFNTAALLAFSAAVTVGMATGAQAADPLPPPVVAPIVVVEVQNPGFYLGVSALYMTRTGPAQAPILNQDISGAMPLPPAPPGDILDARDFDFGWVWGVDARAGIVLPGNFGVEVGGFWLSPFRADVGDEIEFRIVELVTDPPTYIEAYAYEGFNRTRVYGADANVVAHLNGGALQVYAGVAYLAVDDYMYLRLYSDGRDTFLNWASDNTLIGPQVGARFIGGMGPLSIEVGGRVGFLHNSINNLVVVDRPLDTDLTGEDADSVWTLMAAGNVTARFNVTEHFALTAGYQALWLNRVALAPHQVGATDDINIVGPATIGLDTFVAPLLVHGFTAGMSLRF